MKSKLSCPSERRKRSVQRRQTNRHAGCERFALNFWVEFFELVESDTVPTGDVPTCIPRLDVIDGGTLWAAWVPSDNIGLQNEAPHKQQEDCDDEEERK